MHLEDGKDHNVTLDMTIKLIKIIGETLENGGGMGLLKMKTFRNIKIFCARNTYHRIVSCFWTNM